MKYSSKIKIKIYLQQAFFSTNTIIIYYRHIGSRGYVQNIFVRNSNNIIVCKCFFDTKRGKVEDDSRSREVKRIKLQLWKIGDLRFTGHYSSQKSRAKFSPFKRWEVWQRKSPRHRIYSDFHAEGRGCIYCDSFGLIQGNLLRLLSSSATSCGHWN